MVSRELRNAAINCLLAVVFAVFAYAHLQNFVLAPRLSLVLLVGMESVLVVLFLIRREPDQTSHSWQAWLTTSVGTLSPLLLRPTAVTDDLLLGQILQTVGVIVQIAALLSLNRSMGLLPAHRGVKTSGAYRIVRHPLYAGYAIVLLGYLASNWSVYNAAVIIGGMVFQILRIHYEELLLGGYPEYARFTDRTQWRLLPFVW